VHIHFTSARSSVSLCVFVYVSVTVIIGKKLDRSSLNWACFSLEHFLADRTNGRAYATVLRPSSVVVVVVCRPL